jgi:uncharacterized protein involved in exopolysaccharide biosynthesis
MLQKHPQHSTELGYHVAVLRRYWPLLVAGVIVPAAATALYVASATRMYDATATLMVVNAITGKAVEPPTTTATVRALLQSRVGAEKVIAELQLARVVPGITAASFVTDAVRVDEVRGSSLLRLTVRLPDAELAARAANLITELASGPSVIDQQSSEAIVLLRRQLEEASATFEAAEEALASQGAVPSSSPRRLGQGAPGSSAGVDSRRELRQTEQRLGRLAIEHEVLGSVYADFLRRYHEARIAEFGRTTQLRVLDPAYPSTSPAFPRRWRILTIAVFFGLMTAIGAAFVLDASRRPGGVTGARVPAAPPGARRARSLEDQDVFTEVDRRDGV